MFDGKDTVECAVPLEGQDYCKVKANQWLLFLYDPKDQENHFTATLLEKEDMQLAKLYIIFSREELSPPLRKVVHDNSNLKHYNTLDLQNVPTLSWQDFRKYLNKIQKDPKVEISERTVKISRRK